MKFKIFITVALACAGVLSAYASDDLPITQQPEGTVKMMSGSSFSFFYDTSWEMLDSEYEYGLATQFVYADDGKTVYLKNPIFHLPLNTYIKGTLAEGKLTIETPQVIAVTTNDETSGKNIWTVRRMSGTIEEDDWGDEEYIWEIDADNTALTFSVTDQGFVMDGDETVMLGLCVNDEFMEYGETEVKYLYVNTEMPVAPADAEYKPWSLQYGTPNFRIGHSVKAAFSGDDVYIQGLWSDKPEAVVKGIIKEGKVNIPSDQYLGEYVNNLGVTYYSFMSNSYIAEDTYLKLHKTLTEDLVFDFDKGKRMLSIANPEHNIMVRLGNNEGFETTSPVAIMINPSIKENTPYMRPLPPTYASSCFSVFEKVEIPFVMLEFSICPFDEDGNVMDAENLTYSVWVDDYKVVFDAEDAPNYENLPAPTDELPLDFINKWGMANVGDNIFTRRRIQVMETEFEKIGTQVNFVNLENNEKLSSKIAYYHPATGEITIEEVPGAGVGKIDSERQIVSTEYYNLMGIRVDDNFRGMCIKKVRYSDGTAQTVKIVRR